MNCQVRQTAPEGGFGVPLLSQEGPTCCLLPGAAAPYPALGQGQLGPALATNDWFVLMATAGVAVHPLLSALSR